MQNQVASLYSGLQNILFLVEKSLLYHFLYLTIIRPNFHVTVLAKINHSNKYQPNFLKIIYLPYCWLFKMLDYTTDPMYSQVKLSPIHFFHPPNSSFALSGWEMEKTQKQRMITSDIPVTIGLNDSSAHCRFCNIQSNRMGHGRT